MRVRNQCVVLLYIVCILLLLSGCGGSVLKDRQDVERLLPIQTMGFDRQDAGFIISVSSGLGQDEAPALVMQTAASGIEAAVSRLQDYSPQDKLYYAHVQYILVGESAAQETVEPVLTWVERSPAMRMDTTLFIIRGTTAAEAISSSSGGKTDVTERLVSLERMELTSGQTLYTLRQIASALEETGYALCTTVEVVPSKGTVTSEERQDISALIPAGYAVLKEGVLIGYLTQNESFGTDLLGGGTAAIGTRFPVGDNTVTLLKSRTAVSGQWSDTGALTGILVDAAIEAGILETNAPIDDQALETALSQTVCDWLAQAISSAQTLNCDFSGLGRSVARSAPKGNDYSEELWETLFPSLPVTVSVQSVITRDYDLAN